MSIRHRRDPRVDHRMPITVHYGNGAQLYHTQNVAYRGIFLESEEPLQLNRLVKLTIDCEPDIVEFLAIVARRVSQFDASEENRIPGMGLALYSIGEKEAQRWEEFVHDLYEMDPEARRELESKQLTKLHLIIDSGPNLTKLVDVATTDNYIDYHSPRPLDLGAKHLLTITHAADHSLRSSLMVEIQSHPEANDSSPTKFYRLAILNPPSERDEALKGLSVGETEDP